MEALSSAVTLVINPDSDLSFTAVVRDLSSRPFSTPGELQDALREHYPNAAVWNGVVDAAGRPRWYVYREGRWIDPSRVE